MKLSLRVIIASFVLALVVVWLRLEPMQEKQTENATQSLTPAPVEIGQVWVIESDDPFNPESREYLILDTLSGWAKFCKTKYADRPNREAYAMTAKKETILKTMRLKGTQ